MALDTDDSVIYIVLYVGDAEVFRKMYTEISYKSYVKDGSERLSQYNLNCRLLTDADIYTVNGDPWNEAEILSNRRSEIGANTGTVALRGFFLNA